ncbi:hypothetical protein HNR61_005135 [Actinomadura namibiensis]|uniref:Penicillin-binding protein n=2 Tax=Actinomadura TaxID=1988 RepID=A0A7W3LSM4_ACTNM|nr:penicillin-binding transpeptidase domain-containing protein [Actinomadura namibiensis]MBA8953482.1 hypothetical protein [Actinomadura namibiensis]
MRARGVAGLAGALAVVLTGGLGAAHVLRADREPGPERVARDYFAAWRRGALDEMAGLVARPPADFADQHRAMVRGLTVYSVALEPGPVTRQGDTARVEFTADRDVAGHGSWRFRSTLRLDRRSGRWRVAWTPDALYPGLRGPAEWRLRQIRVQPVTFTARDGGALSGDGPLGPYLTDLTDRYDAADGEDGDDEESEPATAWAVEVRDRAGGEFRRLKLLGAPRGEKVRTTIDPDVQAAAEKALRGAPGDGAVVALRPSTGEVLGIADTLGGQGAFVNLYPPGSTFKVVSAAALLGRGMGGGGAVDCPARAVAAQRTITNHEGASLGRTTLRRAFAESCNTTFATLTVGRSRAAGLASAAGAFGFGERLWPGAASAYSDFPKTGEGAELAESAIGQGRVQATPLLMATVAAAVADGSRRSPRLLEARSLRRAGGRTAPPRPVPGAAALRDMMRAVVTEGTAARAGLPAGTAGKTGTAEIGGGGDPHAWFIGFRGDVAFAVFVAGGGSGPRVAAPVAARFLRGL